MDVLKQVRDLVNKNDVNGIIELIDQSDINGIEISKSYWLDYYYILATMTLNQLEKAEQQIIEFENKIDKEKYPLEYTLYLYLQSLYFLKKGQFEDTVNWLKKTIQIFDSTEDLSNEWLEQYGDILHRIAVTYTSKGEYESALEYSLNCLEVREKLGNRTKIGNTLYNLGTTYFQAGKLDQSIQYLDRTNSLFDELGNKLGVAYCKMELGGVYQYQGRLQAALDNFMESHELFKEYGSEKQIAWSLTDLGNVYQKLGEVNKSLDYYSQAIPIYQELDDPRIHGNHLRAMAISYRLKGDYDKAFALNSEALELYRSIENQPFEARALYQIAQDYYEQEMYDRSKEYQLQAENIFIEYSNDDYLARSYFLAIQIHMQTEEVEVSKQYLEKLTNLHQRNSSILIDQQLRYANALIKSISLELEDFVEAKKTFYKISQEEIKDIEITTRAYFTFIDLLFREYKMTGNQDKLEQITNQVSGLESLAKAQSSQVLALKVNMIQAQIKLIEANFDSAYEIITNVKEEATQLGYSAISNLAERVNNSLVDRREELNRLFSQDRDIDEILRISGLENVVSNLINNQYSSVQKRLDQPVFFTIITDSGFSIFSHTFSELKLDDQLLAGFISAVSIFANETFTGTHLLDAIKIGNYQIKIKNENQLKYCYIFMGSTTTAEHKLMEFLNILDTSDKITANLRDSINDNIILDNKEFSNVVIGHFT